jgi:hypothetical protein
MNQGETNTLKEETNISQALYLIVKLVTSKCLPVGESKQWNAFTK